MSPNASERRPSPGQHAFTLLEILVALVASAILLTVLTRFYRNSYSAYNLQEQIAERNQNEYYTIKKLAEILQQAGSALPDTGWDSVLSIAPPGNWSSTSWLVVGNNPNGGSSFMSTTPPANYAKIPIPLGDSTAFLYGGALVPYVLVDYANPAHATVKRRISSIAKDMPPDGFETITVAPPLPYQLDTGSLIYPYRTDSVGLSSNNLVLAGVVLAENIDSLNIKFYDATHNSTTDWNSMKSAAFTVRARTAIPDPNYTLTGGYRKIIDSMNVRFRNKN